MCRAVLGVYVEALARHFVERYRRQVKRDLRGLGPAVLGCLRRYLVAAALPHAQGVLGLGEGSAALRLREGM